MKRLPPMPTIGEIVRMYKLSAQKKLSQNFLLDMNLNHKFVRAAGKMENGFAIEVGPGPGGITRAILDAGVKKLVVVEVDRRFFPGLQLLANASEKRLKIYHGDILNFDLAQIIPEEFSGNSWNEESPNIHILGNLPFNVSTPLIIKWLEAMANHSGAWNFGRVSLTLSFQKEVAERMVADVLSNQRCRLSVMTQYLCHVKQAFTMPGKAFCPPPDVDVGVVHLVPREKPLINVPFKVVEKVCRHMFHFRQKYIRTGILTLFPPDKDHLADEMFDSSGINPELRPFMVSIPEIGQLCHAYHEICDREPVLFQYNYRSKENAKLHHSAKKRQVQVEAVEKKLLNTDVIGANKLS